MKIVDFGMDSVTLTGPLAAKLAAIEGAGFTQVMLSAPDLVGHPGGIDAAVADVRASGLRVTGFQMLRDFEGLSGRLHAYKLDVAKSMLEMCAAVGSKMLLACSSTSTHAATDSALLARDLKKLAMLALPLGIRVAYKALSWGRTVNEFTQACDVVDAADAPNLGLAIDSFHVFASRTSIEDLDLLDPWKIYLVQLSDVMWHETRARDDQTAVAHTFRVFPGEGVHSEPLAELVVQLDKLGYRGDYSFDVFNDDYSQMPLTTVVERSRRSALWLAEDVLQRSAPLPSRRAPRAT